MKMEVSSKRFDQGEENTNETHITVNLIEYSLQEET